jgi:hypothetical protein
VALQSITFGSTGRIDLNGLGGKGNNMDLPGGGGGAGGTIVVETPTLTVSKGAVLAANGGGGAGGCVTCTTSPGGIKVCRHANGQPGQLSATRATGGSCAGFGDGGYGANGSGDPSPHGRGSSEKVAGGGGGGGDGSVILRTRDAAHRHLAVGSVISPVPVLSTVKVN